MTMTVVVTRNVPDRFRGFLASVMCEVAPGVYTGPGMSHGVRDRVWTVLEKWFEGAPDQAVLMTWPDRSVQGGQRFATLGTPKVELFEQDGVFLVRAALTVEAHRSLKTNDLQPLDAGVIATPDAKPVSGG